MPAPRVPPGSTESATAATHQAQCGAGILACQQVLYPTQREARIPMPARRNPRHSNDEGLAESSSVDPQVNLQAPNTPIPPKTTDQSRNSKEISPLFSTNVPARGLTSAIVPLF